MSTQNQLQADFGLSIVTNTAKTSAAQGRTKGVYIGTAQTYDFSFDGSTWVKFQGVIAGTILPIRVLGVRITAGAANPNAGDIVFLY